MTHEIKSRIDQIRRGEVPEGYKKTVVGIVPTEWKIHLLADHLSESRIPGTNGATAKKLTVKLWNKGVVEKREIHEGSESTTYYSRKSGQLIYSKLDFLNCAFGIIPEHLDGYESTQDMPCFDIAGVNPSYLLTYITQKNFYSHFGMIADGGRKARRVGPENMLSFPLIYPSTVEQEKIMEILETQDRLINLCEKKVEQLKKLKKAMLQRMFPKKGENVPEIRFPGFTDPWEQRKLGDCFSERVESMPDGELISVTINDGIKKFSELGRHDNSNEDKSKYKKVCIGDIAYNSMRMWQGASGYSPYEGIVSPAYTVLTPNTGIISKCLAYQFKLPEMTHTFQIHSQGITSDNWNLKYPTLSEIKIFVSPDEKEQEQIASFFTNLDDLIALHQRKCDEEKQKKKALTQLLLKGIVRAPK